MPETSAFYFRRHYMSKKYLDLHISPLHYNALLLTQCGYYPINHQAHMHLNFSIQIVGKHC